MHQAEGRLLGRQLALQGQVHRERAQHRVLGPPRRGRGPQDEVLEGGCREAGEAGRDALGVRVEEGALLGGHRLDRPPRDGAQPQHAHLAVGGERGRAHELGELARRAAAQEVHLEEALLRVDVARRPRDVGAALPAHDRHAERVALDADGRLEAGERPAPVDDGQAAAQARVEPEGGPGGDEAERDGAAAEELRPAPTRAGEGVGAGGHAAAPRPSPSTGSRPPPPPSSPPRGRRGSSCGSA